MAALDLQLVLALNQGWPNLLLDAAMRLISEQIFWVLVALVFIGRAGFRRDWYFLKMCGLMIVLMALADAISYQILKEHFARLRPCHEYRELIRLIDGCGGRFSFPSNHATNAAVIAVLVTAFKGRTWGTWWWAIAVLIGFSRVYLGVHYPSDILAGFVVGSSVSALGLLLLRKSPKLRDFFAPPKLV